MDARDGEAAALRSEPRHEVKCSGCGIRFITDRDEAKCVPCQREDAPY